MTSRLIDKLITLRCWQRGDQRAVHKPLLVLLALGRFIHGHKLILFANIEEELRELLRSYGPTRDSYHPEYPFWRLQNDGIWEVKHTGTILPRKSNTDPPVGELRRTMASGGFVQDVLDELERHPSEVYRAAHFILHRHFPASLHPMILEDTGLDGGTMPAAEKPTEAPRLRRTRETLVRDQRFTHRVLDAYGHRCCICGFDSRIDGRVRGIDAAHLQWHSHQGPDEIDNGLALCPLHHRALDLGILGLSENRSVAISSRLEGGQAVQEHLLRYHGKNLLEAAEPGVAIADRHIEWHSKQVFKHPVIA